MSLVAATVPRLHVVTDDDVLGRPDFLERARTILAAGPAVALHVRGPGTGARRLWELARRLRGSDPTSGPTESEPPGAGAPAAEPVAEPVAGPMAGPVASRAALLVNDRVDVAWLAGADGVHLGGRSLPVAEARKLLDAGAWVGASVHDREGAAATREADYLMVGTIFATRSHPGRPGAGPGHIRAVGRAGGPPLVAVGGVTPDRVAACLDAGAHGVAVLRGVWEAGDTERAVAGYLEALGTPAGAARGP